MNLCGFVNEFEDRHFGVDDLNVGERVKRAKDAFHAIQQLDVFEVNVVVRDEAHVHVGTLQSKTRSRRTENIQIAVRKQTPHILCEGERSRIQRRIQDKRK